MGENLWRSPIIRVVKTIEADYEVHFETPDGSEVRRTISVPTSFLVVLGMIQDLFEVRVASDESSTVLVSHRKSDGTWLLMHDLDDEGRTVAQKVVLDTDIDAQLQFLPTFPLRFVSDAYVECWINVLRCDALFATEQWLAQNRAMIVFDGNQVRLVDASFVPAQFLNTHVGRRAFVEWAEQEDQMVNDEDEFRRTHSRRGRRCPIHGRPLRF